MQNSNKSIILKVKHPVARLSIGVPPPVVSILINCLWLHLCCVFVHTSGQHFRATSFRIKASSSTSNDLLHRLCLFYYSQRYLSYSMHWVENETRTVYEKRKLYSTKHQYLYRNMWLFPLEFLFQHENIEFVSIVSLTLF